MKARHIFLAAAVTAVFVAVVCEATYTYSTSPRAPGTSPGCGRCRGQKGSRGYPGRDGSKGDRGLPGHPGTHGLPGYTGKLGSKGQKGDPGTSIGIKGIKGCKGDIGDRGPSGLPGRDGPYGPPGTPGRKGPPGLKGDKGSHGLYGLPGKDGPSGPKGTPGRKGVPGLTGAKGEKGEKGDPSSSAGSGAGSGGGGGSTYIRWGRNTCDKAEVVYNGIAVARSGSNPICLPKYDQSNDGISLKNVPPVFDFDVPGRASIEGKSNKLIPVGVKHDRYAHSNLLCALCFLPNLPAPTVIVGTHRCPKVGDWKLVYYGQLLTGYYGAGSDYICVDLEKATQRPGHRYARTGRSFAYFLHPVNADCYGEVAGCPTGKRFKEIPCAVCVPASAEKAL